MTRLRCFGGPLDGQEIEAGEPPYPRCIQAMPDAEPIPVVWPMPETAPALEPVTYWLGTRSDGSRAYTCRPEDLAVIFRWPR